MTLFDELVNALCCLPGVGQKSAQRMALHLLERDRGGGKALALTLTQALEKIGHCQICRNFSENEICHICANHKRDETTICLVETPAELLAIEQSAIYSGKYFVLMGHLSPLDGIGAADLGLDLLAARLAEDKIKEIIIATNPTVEGEVTAEYIKEIAKPFAITVSRIAHGVPLGGELGYIDHGTISHAFTDRRSFN